MAETKTPKEITTAIEQAFAERDALRVALSTLVDKHRYDASGTSGSARSLIARANWAASDMEDADALLSAHGYDLVRCTLAEIVSELLARPAASNLRPAVSSGPDPSEKLAGSLFTLLSHLGYEPEGEATPDELARLVDVAMEETASYKRLESEVRALTAALEDKQGRPSARRSLDRIARAAVASGMSPKNDLDDLADYVCARLQERQHGLRSQREPERDRFVDVDAAVTAPLGLGMGPGVAPVGAAIHDEERIRQIVREELGEQVRETVNQELGSRVGGNQALIDELAEIAAKKRKPN